MKAKGGKGNENEKTFYALCSRTYSVEMQICSAVSRVFALRDSLTKIVRERTDSEHLRA